MKYKYGSILVAVLMFGIFCSGVRAEEKPFMKEYEPDKHTVLLLHLNEGKGARAYDSGFFNNNPWSLAPKTKTVSWTEGKFGKAIQFTPSTKIKGKSYLYSSGISIKGTTSSLNPKKEITVEFWAKAKDWKGGTQMIIFKRGQYPIYLGAGGVYFGVFLKDGKTDQYKVFHNLANNTWHHFALVYDGKTVDFFIDGEIKKSVEKTGDIAGHNKSYPSITIGCGVNGQYPFDGIIDEVRISDIARKEFKGTLLQEPIETLKKKAINPNAVYLKDLNKFTPSEAISTSETSGKWWLKNINGKKVLWAGKSASPPLTYPLKLKGWYDIYVALYTYPYPVDYEDCNGIHIKLTKDKWFTHIAGGRNGIAPKGCIDEIFWKRAKLTDEDIILYQPHGRFFKPVGGINYIKLVPLTEKQAKDDAIRKKNNILNSKSKLVGGIDDFNDWVYKIKGIEKKDTEMDIESHKINGFNMVFFRVNSHGYAIYHSKISEWYNHKNSGDPRKETKIWEDILKNHDPLRVASEQAKKIGVKFFAWFSITNDAKSTHSNSLYAQKYENMKICGSSGPMKGGFWPSLGYKEIRDYKLSLIKEIVNNYNIDGILTDFTARMPVIGYEPPVLDAYVKKYGVDPRIYSKERGNLRWKRFRADYITAFLKDVVKIVRQAEKKSGRKIEIAARVCARDNLWKGLDVETWIKEGLIDIVIPSNAAYFDPFVPVKPFIEMAKGTKCKVLPCIQPFFAGGTDDPGHHPNKNEKEVSDIIKKRCYRGASNLEIAKRVLEYYGEKADGVVFYESSALPERQYSVIRYFHSPKKTLSFVKNYEEFIKKQKEEIIKNAKVFLNLKDGETVSGKVDIIAKVEGFTPSSVEFYIDGEKVSTERGAPYWCFGDYNKWDTTKIKNGIHRIKTVATDSESDISISSEIKVMVRN